MIVLKTILTWLDEQHNTKLSEQPPFVAQYFIDRNEPLTYLQEKSFWNEKYIYIKPVNLSVAHY